MKPSDTSVMDRWSRRLWGLVGIALVILAVTVAHRFINGSFSTSSGEKPEPELLWINPEQLNFGEVWATSHHSWSLTVENRSGRTLKVKKLIATCDCTKIQPESFTLEPGASQRVDMELDFSLKKLPEPKASVPFQMSLRPVFDGENNFLDQEWQLTGVVRSAIFVPPGVIDFGRISKHEQEMPMRSIKVEHLIPLSGMEAVIETAYQVPKTDVNWKVDITRDQLNERSSTIHIQLVPPFPSTVESYHQSLVITPNSKGEGRLPSLNIPLRYAIVRDVQAIPPAVMIEPSSVGTLHEERRSC